MSSEVAELARAVDGLLVGWRNVRFGDVSRSFAGGTPSRSNPAFYGPGIPWLKSGEVRAGRISAVEEEITEAGLRESSARVAKAGSPVIAMYGATAGVAGILEIDAALNQAVLAIEPVATRLDSEFCFYLLSSEAPRLLTMTQGSGQPNLSKGLIDGLNVALPPLDEQRRIAEVLRSVDEAIAANSATLAATRQIVEKLARDVADGGSDTATISEFGRVVTGGTPSPKQADLWGGDLPFVTPGDLNEDEVSVRDAARTLNVDAPHGARVLPAGSVLVTCIGSTVGKTAIARSSCATNQQINSICCDPALSGYLYLACVAAYDEIMANAGKQAVPIINKSTFSAITVPTRSRIEMVAVSEMVDALDNEGKAARSALTALNAIKSAFMGDLLSGHVRVPA